MPPTKTVSDLQVYKDYWHEDIIDNCGQKGWAPETKIFTSENLGSLFGPIRVVIRTNQSCHSDQSEFSFERLKLNNCYICSTCNYGVRLIFSIFTRDEVVRSALYFGLAVFCLFETRVQNVTPILYNVHCTQNTASNSGTRASNRQNTASPKHNDNISLLISKYLISDFYSRKEYVN